MSIYKPCDIRGPVTELSSELYSRWGAALAKQVAPRAKFVVGGDCRATTPQFVAGLADGLCRAGLDVVDLGQLPTPMVYYASRRLQAAGCAIVTASHNPADINGLKWMIGDRPPTPHDVDQLRTAAAAKGRRGGSRQPSAPRALDVTFDYVAWLQETFVEAMGAQLHVVLDPMHGCWAARARRYLHAVFPQCLFTLIHDTPEADFGGSPPDCSRHDVLHELAAAVYRERAHLGLAFDGDGDRVAVVDNESVPLGAEETTWLLLQSQADTLAGQRFVCDLKFSDCIAAAAKALGAEPVVERSGHAFIRARMRAADAVFGAEVSGHYFYRALQGGDDGLYTACRLIAYLAGSGERFADLRRRCPPVFMTPDLRVDVPPAAQEPLLEDVRATWAKFPQTALDGVRIDMPDGWALVRKSVTEPAMTFRFESSDWVKLASLVERFCDKLPNVGDELWVAYLAAMGAAEDDQ